MSAEGPDGDRAAAVAIHAAALSLGGGLLSLVRPALVQLEPGGILAIISSNVAASQDLPAWCRTEGHHYLGSEQLTPGVFRHLIGRGEFGVLKGDRERCRALPRRKGQLFAADVLASVPMPERADGSSGFAPRGAQIEPGGPSYPFTQLERDRVAPPEVAKLYDQAVAGQWDSARDIPWSELETLPPALECAVSQIMTFLAENELSALYVPSRFIAQIHPAYVEVAMFLATQLGDEARHIDVFLKRARAGTSGLGISSVTTSRSLLTLLETNDFIEASFLLSVLGEGTFLDLLRFVEEHAPDSVTREIVRRARIDEARHVHFGLAHVGHALGFDPGLYGRLENAVRRRAATLHGMAGVPAPIQDALTILAAGSTEPTAVARGHDAFRTLLETMHEARIKRLLKAGFDEDQARTLSELHTPNFM